MSEPILILGSSGSGKSDACRELDPAKTLLISVDGKRFPFPMKEWPKLSSENPSGSFYIPVTDQAGTSYDKTKRAMLAAVKNGKNKIVIDDSQFLISNQFFEKAFETGFQKFTDLGFAFWDLIRFSKTLPDDVIVYFLHHLEKEDGKIKVKTAGKMLDQQTCIEGKFTVCLLAEKIDGNYSFTSSLMNDPIAKAPRGMFEEKVMENNLANVDQCARDFWGM
tara:strand:- start:26 stop:688 length:663 start_codon:yes stop_codon:yes gene_type:complete